MPLPYFLLLPLLIFGVFSIPLSDVSSHSIYSEIPCDSIAYTALDCNIPANCTFGMEVAVTCTVADASTQCSGDRTFDKTIKCLYCFQLEEGIDYTCSNGQTPCSSDRAGSFSYECETFPSVMCLGSHSFRVSHSCAFQNEYDKPAAIILSVLFGGIGLDRLYLGYFATAFLKVFTLGGFGIWIVLDVLAITTGYLKPADGSLYHWTEPLFTNQTFGV